MRPVFSEPNQSEQEDYMYRTPHGGINLSEDDAIPLIYPFLTGLFDQSVQERRTYEREGFDWYGKNYYSVESFKNMLIEIRRANRLLQTNYDSPELDFLKNSLRTELFLVGDERWTLPKEAFPQKTKERITLATDFYDRLRGCNS